MKISIFTLAILLLVTGCSEKNSQSEDFEEQAILERLNNETKDAFQRDYEAWTKN